jgi:hypothetical protein
MNVALIEGAYSILHVQQELQMKEVTLRSFFCPLREDTLILTVDEDRVYRVYLSEDRLSVDRKFNYDDGMNQCSFASYKEALKIFKLAIGNQKANLAWRQKKQMDAVGVIDAKVYHEDLKTWIGNQIGPQLGNNP